MNKIYRLVWDSSRQMLIPVSELSPSHGKSRVVGAVKEKGHAVFRLKKLYIVLAALQGLLFVPQAQAFVQSGGAYCTNGTQDNGGTTVIAGNCVLSQSLSGDLNASIAIGTGARSSNLSVALGLNALAGNTRTIAFGDNAQALGQESVAIGYNSTARGTRSVVIGAGASSALTDAGVSIGYHNQLLNTVSSTADNYNSNMLAVGNENTIDAPGRSMTFGSWNKISDSSLHGGDTDGGSLVMGFQNTVTNSHNAYVFSGQGVVNNSAKSVVIGQHATVENSDSAIVIGGGSFDVAAQKANSSKVSNSAKGIAVGELSELTNASGGIILGNNGAVTASNGLILGNSGSVSAASGVLLGNNGKVSAANGLALGNNTSVANANSVALGSGSVTSAAIKTASVTLGGKSYSFAGAAPGSTVSIGTSGMERTLTNLAAGQLTAASTDGVNGSQLYATNTALNTLYGDVNALAEDALLWDASKNAYSATHGTATTNKITNVAAGALNSSSTDAVNGSQLFTTNQNVATNTTNITKNTQAISTLADTPLTFKGNTGSVIKKLGDTVNIVGGASTAGSFSSANISTSVDNQTGNLIIQMADNPVFTSATIGGTAGNTKLDNTGLTISNGPTVTTSGISAGSKKITNVAAAALNSNSTEGVNGSQLYATNQNVASNTTNITNLGNTIQNINNTGTKYFHANSTGTDSNATGNDSVAIGMGAIATNANDVALGAGSVTASAVGTSGATIAGSSYTFAGVSPKSTVSVGTLNNERTITNVAAGRLTDTSTDAVNGSQLYATNSALNTLNNNVSGLQNDALLWDPTLNAFSASHGTTAVNKITNVKDGDLTANSTDAVNGSQLKATNDQVATNTQNITQNTKDIGDVDNRVTNIYDTGTKYFHANSVGSDSSAQGLDSVAIGMGAVALHANDIALGAGSKTAKAVGTDKTTLAGTEYTFAGTNPLSTLSIGDVGSERTITNVAAGRLTDTSTDAVNGSQLYATNSALNTLNNNVSGLQNDALLWDPTLNAFSASHGTTAVNKITNVMDGELSDTSTDAVNGSQLKSTNDQVATNTQNITQNTQDIANVDNRVTNIYDTGTKYFHANSTGKDSSALGDDSVAIGMGAVANNDNDIALGAGSKTTKAVKTEKTTLAGTEYYFAGIDPQSTLSIGDVGSERTITNVAAGRLTETSTDAVNGSQLFATNSAIENIYGDVQGLQNDALLWDPALNAFSASHGSKVINKITNVAEGELSATSTDAVNGSQLYATNVKVENIDNRLIGVEDVVYGSIVPTMRYLKVNSTGTEAMAIGADAVALGQGTLASGDNSVATGNGAQATGSGAIANGHNANAAGEGSVAIGENASVMANNSVALGAGSVADRDNTVSVGAKDNERQITNVAAGTEDTDAVNVAQLKEVSGDVSNIGNTVNNIANGTEGMFQVNNTDNYAKPVVKGNNAVAGGAGSKASGSNSMAIGTLASSTAENSVALGNGSSATASNSVALGANSVADRMNTVSVGVAGGERQITNVAAGTELTDAVNVGQLKQTEANANQYTNNQFKALKNMVNDQKDKLSAGIAGAMAMSGLPQPYSPGASMVGMAGGTYQGQSAIALGVSTISDNGKWVTKLSGSTNSQGDFGAAIGVGYQW
ncbi:YadA-like family protein [Enterobacter cloacae]|nr:YadA-like family protein [Enterobacter cloacae]